MISKEFFSEEQFKRNYGVDRFLIDTKEGGERRALVGQATCNLAGLGAGYAGNVPSNIVPKSAIAKLDFRLVPDMDPKIQFDRLVHHQMNAALRESFRQSSFTVCARRELIPAIIL